MRLPNLLEVELLIEINRELEAKLLSFGKDVTILTPLGLRADTRLILEQTLKAHSEST
ncbi:hypothetical protein Slin_1205 [Spirosoma linguale DSM 74]|uniref:Uncharacterized protein n=1 Tax=Spirosoma linguale (strain ATCC 33905 / DSM 74 / LMG 10896 / Claus 1) TaxID=504472 RepID=D2QL17_SPILD|nr:hypothetical protein Slin_1205 [Spirosoma linguale DSM 74]